MKRRLVRRLVAVALGAGAVVLIVVLVLVALFHFGPRTLPSPGPGVPEGERPNSQPADCADVQVFAVPGTWESREGDDPYAPTANPLALLLGVTGPLAGRFAPTRANVQTIGYPAQFRNPQPGNADQLTYDGSRARGTSLLRDRIAATHAHCPLTSYVLIGFSQGAVIAGDVAGDIGNGRGPVAADLLRGAVLIADGRREPGVGVQVGTSVPGVGAEIALLPLAGLTGGFGATMTGPRPGGFGAAADRVRDVCAPGDLICDAPRDLGGGLHDLGRILAPNTVHAQYANNPAIFAGTTAVTWSVDTIGAWIDEAPQTPRS